MGKVYLHAVGDTYGSYGFGFLHTSKQPEAAVAVPHKDVLPFYGECDLAVTAVLTDNGREFCGTGNRNLGRRPIDTVNLFFKPVSGEA